MAINTTRDTVSTAGGILQARRDFDWSGIFMRYVNQFPLPTLINKLGKEKATNPKFDHFEDELLTDTVATSTNYLTTETAIVMVDSSSVVIGDVLHNPLTGENLYVSNNVVATNTCTVTRGYASTTAANIASGQSLRNIGPTFAEGTSLANPVSTKVELKTNYCQIFKKTIALTKTLQASTLYGGPDEKHQTMKAEIEFMRGMNYALQFGSKSTSESIQRTTGGLIEWITTNVTDVSAASLTQSAFDTFIQSVFENTTDSAVTSKVLLASPLLSTIISSFGTGKLTINDKVGSTPFGLHVTTYISPLGPRVDIVTDWLLKGTTYGAWGWLLDLNQIKYKFLREVMMRRNVQNPGDDAVKHELIAEVGLKIINEKSHGIIKNFTA